jgi:hypothetical protein
VGASPIGYTIHDKDLVVNIGDSYGAITYLAKYVEKHSEAAHNLGGSSDNIDVTTVLFKDDSLDVQQSRAGYFDDARVDILVVRWDDTTQYVKYLTGFAGEVNVDDQTITITFQELTGKFNQNILREIKYNCSHDLFDDRPKKCRVANNVSEWVASTLYVTRTPKDAIGEGTRIVKPKVATQANPKYWFRCKIGGTSAGSEPAWPSTLGATIVDGTVTWEAIYARRRTGTVTTVTNNSEFAASSIDFALNYATAGYVEWLTGNNVGVKTDIFEDDGAGNIELFMPMFKNIQVGDTFIIFAGCDKLASTCFNKFWNIFNHGGFPDVPGLLDSLQMGSK